MCRYRPKPPPVIQQLGTLIFGKLLGMNSIHVTDAIHYAIEQFGLLAIFIGSLFEGETIAILGGFFAHQSVLVPWQVFVTVYAGAYCGDAALFLAGKHLSSSSLVKRLETKPAFAYAQRMVRKHPTPYLLLNRYVYGLRMIGGVVAGLAGIKTSKFVILNAIATLLWASIFTGIGYVFGTAAEQVIGSELARHQRVLIAFGVGGIGIILGLGIIRKLKHRVGRHEV